MSKGIENLVPFEKGTDIRINRKGRYKKVLTELETKLLKEGYAPVSKAEFISYMSVIIGLPEDKWNQVKSSNDIPKLIKEIMIAVEKDKRFVVIPDILDRLFGKAKEEFLLNHKTDNNSLITPIQVIINGQIKD